jgi:hypothetical protein
MKIAYLILAHNQPDHLFRMINALNTENSSFYVHIDKKSDIAIFNPSQYPKNVFFQPDRTLISHGGFSMVIATLGLMEEALKDEQNNYFIFLSGWDYPIKRNEFIHKFLSNSYPMNFLSFYALVGNADLIENIQKYFFTDFIGRFPKFMQVPLKFIQSIYLKIPMNRKFLPGMIPYRGSSSYCLNRETISHIADFTKGENGEKYFEFFKYVLCPDEIFFHTIVLNSPYAEQCRFYERDIVNLKAPMKNENKAYLHHIDWNPERENPAILNMTDFDKLISSEMLFARKFNEVKSKQLLEALDQSFKAGI